MSLFGFKHDITRDIIIVTGCNAVGKTTASNHLREWTTKQNILYENSIIADSQCLFEAMQMDDRAGGFHHTHDWCHPGIRGHFHDLELPIFPFTVIDNELPNTMRKRFFKKLTKLRSRGKFWFVEWAGGVNTNRDSSIDYSYALAKSMLEEGKLPNTWLKRVKAVIHVTADEEVRFALNKQRTVPFSARPEEIENGTAFWQKDERILRFYGRDDFFEIEGLLEKAGITVCTIKNNGSSCFFEDLETAADMIFSPDRIAVAKTPKISSNTVAVAKTTILLSAIGAAIHGLSVFTLGTSSSHSRAEILPTSAGASHLEEQEKKLR
jgi:hypothetical protein